MVVDSGSDKSHLLVDSSHQSMARVTYILLRFRTIQDSPFGWVVVRIYADQFHFPCVEHHWDQLKE
eukprot:scaffold12174_cov66-Cylindrotheca_fusiformis.AAC.4